MTLAHVAGMPIEETVGAFAPAFLLVLGAASASLRARLHNHRKGKS